MKLFALLWLIFCVRCQENERIDGCTGEPNVECICAKMGVKPTPGAKGQKGETSGLNYTLTNLVKKELNDVKTKLITAEAKYDRLKEELDDIKSNLTSSEENFNAVTRELANVKEARLFPPSCSDINGTTADNGEYLINSDPQHVTPFLAFCNFSRNASETIIRHNSMDEFEFTGCEPALCYKKKIVYEATLRQMIALIKLSRNCRQFIKLRCINVVINWSTPPSYAGWLSRNGTFQSYWGGATSRRPNYCACGESGSCSVSNIRCNCDRNDNSETSDEGFLTYKDHLPVTEIQFGDTGNDGERGWHTLGPLICSN